MRTHGVLGKGGADDLGPSTFVEVGGKKLGRPSLVSSTGYRAGKIRTVTYRKGGSAVLLANRTGSDTLRKGRVRRPSQRVVGRDNSGVDDFLNSGWN